MFTSYQRQQRARRAKLYTQPAFELEVDHPERILCHTNYTHKYTRCWSVEQTKPQTQSRLQVCRFVTGETSLRLPLIIMAVAGVPFHRVAHGRIREALVELKVEVAVGGEVQVFVEPELHPACQRDE